jgi:hypothetical protein
LADQIYRPHFLIGPIVVAGGDNDDEFKVRKYEEPLVAIADTANPSLPTRSDGKVGIQLAGPDRTMFESNFPVDEAGCSYRVLWNAFRRMAADYSESEKADLFASSAIRAYRLPEALGQPSIVAEQFASKRFGQTDINSPILR